jgi:signal transduction histidine kinase
MSWVKLSIAASRVIALAPFSEFKMRAQRFSGLAIVSASRPVILGFALAIGTLLLISVVTLGALSRRTLNGQSVTQSFAVLHDVQRLMAEIDDSQLSLADFVLTGDKESLEPYQSSRTTIPQTLAELAKLTAQRAGAQRQLEELRPVLSRALELDAGQADERLRGAPEDQLRSTILRGKALLRQSDEILDRLKDDTAQLLQTEQQALLRSQRASTLIVIGGDLVLLLLILAAAAMTLRDSTEKVRAVQFQRRMLGMVGHDLRNPLSVVMMSAAQLGRLTDATDRRQNAISRILGSAHRMERMIRDLLDYSRIELQMGLPLIVRPSDVDSCCQRVLDEFQTVYPTREIHYQSSGERRVLWDDDRIERVIENLVGNALKYSPDDTPVNLTWSRDGDRVIIEVSNQGAPIPDELVPHLFEAFRRGNDRDADIARQSHGLGLYIVRHIILQHGGEISVQSSAATGTTFRVAVPQPLPTSAAA